MAQKPDGKPARTERVTFTKNASERIAKAVRRVEAGNRDAKGISFGVRLQGDAKKTFRICTFTGAWSTGSFKTVTFKYNTTTPNTASAVNLFFSLPDDGTKNCAIAKDGTAWHLIQWQWVVSQCNTATSS